MPSGLNWLGLTGDVTNLDALRQQVIDLWELQTCRLWEERVGYVQEIIPPRGDDVRTIFLELWPITTITKVEQWTGNEYTEVLAADYYQYHSHGLRLSSEGCWLSRIRVTYTAGYLSDDLPEDVRYALLIQAKFMLSRIMQGNLLIVSGSQSFDGGNTQYLAPNLHPYFEDLAKKRKRKT